MNSLPNNNCEMLKIIINEQVSIYEGHFNPFTPNSMIFKILCYNFINKVHDTY